MYLLYMFIGIFLIVSIMIFITFRNKLAADIVWILLTAFIGCGTCWAMICGMSQCYLETSMQEVGNVEIYSLNNDTQISGHFVFGSGTISEEMYYYYYVKGDYGYKIEKLEAKNVEIIEREDEELIANIITYKKMLIKENNWVAFGKEIFEQTYKIVMYVPKGSVKITYNVSL